MPVPDWLRAIVPQRLRKYLPTNAEGGDYTGPLSTFAEYHALFLGLAVGFTGDTDVLAGVIGYITARGNEQRKSHWKDAAKELGYTGGGIVLGVALRFLGVSPTILPSLL